MDNNDELIEINIENCTRYYFDDIIKMKDFDFDNILIDEKSYDNFLVCDSSQQTLILMKTS